MLPEMNFSLTDCGVSGSSSKISVDGKCSARGALDLSTEDITQRHKSINCTEKIPSLYLITSLIKGFERQI